MTCGVWGCEECTWIACVNGSGGVKANKKEESEIIVMKIVT